ncbi:hypothetical protein F4803DRAFT_543354 [Xylaria telfairii]|nr:hypothetical protein F4803DRAFT_543354 [Xylaria telfairii]
MHDAGLSFLSLSSELRNAIYDMLLLYQEPIDPWAIYRNPQAGRSHPRLSYSYVRACYSYPRAVCPRNEEDRPTLALFRANKAVHREASSLFYGRNRFNLSEVAPQEVVAFLERIGVSNAAYIRHVIVDFPVFIRLDPDYITLEESSLDVLTTMQTRCTNLASLRTQLYSTVAMELRLDNVGDHQVAADALQLLDTHFRAISSLQDIIVEVYEDGPSDRPTRQGIKRHGWTIATTPYMDRDLDQAARNWDWDWDFEYEQFGDLGAIGFDYRGQSPDIDINDEEGNEEDEDEEDDDVDDDDDSDY